MKKENKKPIYSASIRQRAEDQLKNSSSLIAGRLIEAESTKVLYELQVHQIELEMQNEELLVALEKTATAYALYDFAPSGYLTLDCKGIIFELNRAGARLLGSVSSGLLYRNLFQFVTEDTQSLLTDFFGKIFAAGSRQTCEIRLINQGIPSNYVLLEGIVFDDELKCLVTMVDITERKRAEEEVLVQKRFFEQVFSQSSVSTQILDKEGWCERINPRLSEIFGVKPEDIEGKVYNIFQDESIRQGGILPYLDKVFNEHKTAEWDVYFDIGLAAESQHIEVADKKKIWLHNWAYPILDDEGHLIHVIIQHTDITESKKAEEARRNSEICLHTLVQTIPDLIWLKDRDGVYLLCNTMFERFFGAREVEIVGKTDYDFVDRELADFFRENDCKAMNQGKSLSNEEWVTFADDGHRALLDTIKTPMYDAAGMIIGVLGISHDITKRKKAEDKLKLFLFGIESGYDGIIISNMSGRISFANIPAIRIFGYHRDELMEMNVASLNVDPIIAQRMTSELMVNGNWSGETQSVKKNGEIFPNVLSISVIKGDDGNPIAMMGIFRDITEKKEVAKRVNLLARSLESINECVSITDSDDIILYINESLLQTYGYREEELIGKHIGILRPPEIEHKQLCDILQLTKVGGWKGEIINKRKDGTLFPILLSTSVINDEDENSIAFIGVARDITELKSNREELIAAKENAEESNRLKSAFLANMSHEIRTPMNAIIGFSDLILDAEPEERILYAAIVQKSSKQLLMLIDDVIQMSRLQSEKLPLNILGFKPAELVSDVYQMFNLPDFKKLLDLFVNIPVQYKNLTVRSDKDKIRQVLTILASNAMKYTFKGSVEFGFVLHNGDIEFYVKDSGIGIPEQEQQLIFETFYRGKQAISYAIGGTGLGLKIAKELVELLGGQIGVNSEPGNGAYFFFRIPVE